MVSETKIVTEISEEIRTASPPAKVTFPSVPDKKAAPQEKPLEGLAGAIEQISQSIPKADQTNTIDPPAKNNATKEHSRKIHSRPSMGFD